MRRDTTPTFEISKLKRRTQFKEGITTEHGGNERGVGLEYVVHLTEDRRQIVDPMEGERGEHCIVRIGGVMKKLEVGKELPLKVDVVVEGKFFIAVKEGRG